MTDSPSIFPSLTELRQWESLILDEEENVDVVLLRVFQAGADQELEKCCEWVGANTDGYGSDLRAARRPKPPSLKEQALEDLGQIDGYAVDQLSAYVIYGDLKRRVSNIRRALEALPDN